MIQLAITNGEIFQKMQEDVNYLILMMETKNYLPLPWNYGEKFETMFVNANGFVTFSEASEEYGHFPLPSAMMPSNLVAAFATDLNPSWRRHLCLV